METSKCITYFMSGKIKDLKRKKMPSTRGPGGRLQYENARMCVLGI